ncbi:MAG: hypothetical protein OXP12_00140, partial [Thaumarchaeota archaeon]|nr:hypothetical protein [Nitrososphaerota archaeon]MDE0266898.1 hypothetical protein [Nitrososphaerota archaeon]
MRIGHRIVMVAVASALCAVVAGVTAAIPAHAQTVGEIPETGITVQTVGTHITIDWQDADRATKYLVQIYTGTRLTDSLFVTDSILVNRELRAGVTYVVTATPYWDFRAGVERELARVYITP